MATHLALLLSALLAFAPAAEARTLNLTYYVHDWFVYPDSTGVEVASADGELTYAGQFGDVLVFDSPLREGAGSDSRVVGSTGAHFVYTKATNLLTFVHELRVPDRDLVGTLTGAGLYDFSRGAWEVAVTGGTGSFAAASGHAAVTVVRYNASTLVLRNDVSVDLPSRRPIEL